MPQIKTKKVWNTDTWEYDKQLVVNPPKTAISRLIDNYKKVFNNEEKETAKNRLLGAK